MSMGSLSGVIKRLQTQLCCGDGLHHSMNVQKSLLYTLNRYVHYVSIKLLLKKKILGYEAAA